MTNKQVILCIEDNEVDRKILQRYLTRYPGQQYEFHEASTALEGYEKIKSLKPDCIFVDYLLPDQNGLEFIHDVLINTPECPPILMLTGQGNEDIAAAAISMGVFDYIIKSKITAPGLYRSIHHAIEKWSLLKKIKEQNKNLILANHKLESINQEIIRSHQALSHELKTPLTSLQEFMSILKDELVGPLNPEQTRIINFSVESCELMRLYIKDLLDTSLLDIGRLAIHLQLHSLNKIVDMAVASTQPAMLAKNILLRVNLHANLPLVQVDDKRIYQVIVNLINNAIKFTPEKGKIEINVFPDPLQNNFVRVEISDNGVGIPIEEQTKIFDRFYQVKKLATDPHGGLGLGLTICKQLINLHGGTISVTSAPGVGSTFSFTMPVTCTTKMFPTSLKQ